MKTSLLSRAPEGTQSIHRATTLLRLLAVQRGQQMTLSRLAQQSGLSTSTTHRILQGLVAEGWVCQDSESARYCLGPLAYEIGLAARPAIAWNRLAADALDRLAAESGDTAVCSVRSEVDAVCIDRREGSFPIRTLTLDVGSRRPLGVGAAALALLMHLPDDRIQEIVQVNAPRLPAFRMTTDSVLEAVERSRSLGYALNDGQILPGYKGVALAFLKSDGQPLGALSLAAIADRMSELRQRELVGSLRREVTRLERLVGSDPQAVPPPKTRLR